MSNSTVTEKVASVVRTVLMTYEMAVFHAGVQTVSRAGILLSTLRTWLEQHISDVFNTSALHEYTHILSILLIYILLFTTFALNRFFNCPRPSAPRIHRRTKTPTYPPGMELDLAEDRWRKQGMEKPLIEVRDFGAVRPAEMDRKRREVSGVPEGRLPELPPIVWSFGREGWN